MVYCFVWCSSKQVVVVVKEAEKTNNLKSLRVKSAKCEFYKALSFALLVGFCACFFLVLSATNFN